MPVLLARLSLALAQLALVPIPDPKAALRMEADGVVVLRSLGARLPAAGEGLAVWLLPGSDPAPVLELLRSLGADVVSLSLRTEGARVQATLPAPEALASVAAALAGFEGVAALGPWAVPVALNDDSIWVGQSYDTVGRATPVFDHGITGSGETVAVYDTGLDPDMCFFVFGQGQWSPAQSPVPPDIGTLHPTEKTLAYYVEPGATAYDPGSGHGTWVSGCVLGDDWATPSSAASAGHDPGDGMAPSARLVVMDGGAGGALSGIVGDLTPMFQQAYDAGARIENHSWGSPGLNAYAPDAADIDRFMWRHEDMLFVNAAGNSGGAPNDGSVIDPAVAKNAVAVGATTSGGALARDLAGFTSRGPTFDGRIRPDVVAPGDSIRTAFGSGVQDDDNCGLSSTSGTSFSAPTVAGWLALLRQYLREGFLPGGAANPADAMAPSAALLKAALIASAVPLEGNDPTTGAPVDPPPSFNQGFGRPLLDNVLYFAGDGRRSTVLDVANARGLGAGESATLTLDLSSSAQPLQVVLAWTDPPADPGAPIALVNDIDLVVTDPLGATYRGNVWSGGESTTGGSADTRNPIEAVKIGAPLPGRWLIRIEAARPLGRTGMDGSERQGYALVLTYPTCSVGTAAPTGLSAQDRTASIDLAWNPVPGALGYLVYRADLVAAPAPADYRLVGAGPITSTSFSDLEVQCGSDYAYLVRAWNGCALGPASAPRSLRRARGSCTLVPAFAGLVDARPGAACGEVSLSWEPALSRCPCSTGLVYNVWASPDSIDPSVLAPALACISGTSVDLDVGAGSGLMHFLVRAEDRVPGGSGRCGGVADGNRVELRSAPLSPTTRLLLRDDLEAGRSMWRRATLSGAGAWDVASDAFAASPVHALRALDLGFPSDSTATLVPSFTPGSDSLLAFRHTWELEGRFDGGVIEYSIDDGANWLDAGALLIQGRYPDWLMTGAANRIIRPGFTAGTLGPMTESVLWLGALAGQSLRFRFRMLSDASGRRERWAIDDFRIAERDCPPTPGALVAAFVSDAPACEGTPVAFDAGSSYGGTPPFRYDWDFGDGSPGTSGVLGAHVYASSGTYDVVLTVRDAAAGVDTVTMPVQVVSDALPPAIDGTLRAVKRGADVALSWTEPAGNWQGATLGWSASPDFGAPTTETSLAWDLPRAWLSAGAVTAAPTLRHWRVRLGSACSGRSGPW